MRVVVVLNMGWVLSLKGLGEGVDLTQVVLRVVECLGWSFAGQWALAPSFLEQPPSFLEQPASFFEQPPSFLEHLASLVLDSFLPQLPAPHLLSWLPAAQAEVASTAAAKAVRVLMFMVVFLVMKG